MIAYNNFINCPTDSGDCKQVIVVAHPVVANAREREEEECDDDPIIKIHISALFDLQLSSIVENLTVTKIKIKLISTMHVLSLSQSHPFAGWTLFVIFFSFLLWHQNLAPIEEKLNDTHVHKRFNGICHVEPSCMAGRLTRSNINSLLLSLE